MASLSNQGIIQLIILLYLIFLLGLFITALLINSLGLLSNVIAILADISLFITINSIEGKKLSSGTQTLETRERIWLQAIIPTFISVSFTVVETFLIILAIQRLDQHSYVNSIYFIIFGSIQLFVTLVCIGLFYSRNPSVFIESQSDEMTYIDQAFDLDLDLNDSHDNENDNSQRIAINSNNFLHEEKNTNSIFILLMIYLINNHTRKRHFPTDKKLKKNTHIYNVDMITVYSRICWDFTRSLCILSLGSYFLIKRSNHNDSIMTIIIGLISILAIILIFRDIIVIILELCAGDGYSAISKDDDDIEIEIDDGVIS